MPVPGPWVAILDEFDSALIAAARPATTRATRCGHIKRLARELRLPPEQVTPGDLTRWFAKYEHWSRETRRSHRNSVAVFFAWAHDAGLLPTNPAAKLAVVKADLPAPKPAPDRVWRESLIAAPARVMVMLYLACIAGLRRAEVAQVNTRDLIEGFDGWQLLVHGKGGKERIIPITDELAAMIAAGAAGHSPGEPAQGWLFPGQIDGHLSPAYVGKLCSEAMPGVWSMHSLRHRFATRAYRGTRNIRAVQELLGHTNVAITQRYTAVDDEEMRAAMNAAAAPVRHQLSA